MSKQYLAQHTIDEAHRVDIYALVTTSTSIISASGESSIKIHATNDSDFPIAQTLPAAHKLGVHHLAVSSSPPTRLVSVGFGGETKIWKFVDGIWQADGEIHESIQKAGEVWAVALSSDGQYLAATTAEGRVNVWDLLDEKKSKIREFETKGSFGMSIDISSDGTLTATGHQNGSIYVFSNATTRLLHALPTLINPVRAVSFSPASKLLAAAGDARVIALYDATSGEQIANLTGHAAWVTSLSWSRTGEFLLSGALDGKCKVWSVDRRECVATHSETDKALWTVRWLPRGESDKARVGERFVTAGGSGSIAVYREATGG